MGQRWFVDRHLPGHTYQSSEIFRIIAWEKPPLALQPTGHLLVWKCRQETYHADGDAGRLDAIDHFRSNCFGLGVETDDETGQNIHASRIDFEDALFQAAPCILLLLYRDERVAVGTFDANENRKEIRLAHHRQKLGMVGEVDRRFGREFERIAVLLLPCLQPGSVSV